MKYLLSNKRSLSINLPSFERSPYSFVPCSLLGLGAFEEELERGIVIDLLGIPVDWSMFVKDSLHDWLVQDIVWLKFIIRTKGFKVRLRKYCSMVELLLFFVVFFCLEFVNHLLTLISQISFKSSS